MLGLKCYGECEVRKWKCGVADIIPTQAEQSTHITYNAVKIRALAWLV